jgi:hypothetical protein
VVKAFSCASPQVHVILEFSTLDFFPFFFVVTGVVTGIVTSTFL